MNKEQIKKFWDDHKVEIIGGTFVLASLAIIGVSVGSAMNIKIEKERKALEIINKQRHDNFVKEVTEIGAVLTGEYGNPVATKEVVDRWLEKGDVYHLDQLNDNVRIVWVLDTKN